MTARGTFDPQIARKHQRRLAGFDQAVISLYAKGMTCGDIAAHLSDVYGTDVSRDLVSRVTDQVLDDMRSWQSRPLDPVCPVVLVDCVVLKIREGQVANRPVYVALGIDLDGRRDVLGLWVGPSGGEGAKQWMNMLTELRNRGVLDVCVVCCDGLRGLPEARPSASWAKNSWIFSFVIGPSRRSSTDQLRVLRSCWNESVQKVHQKIVDNVERPLAVALGLLPQSLKLDSRLVVEIGLQTAGHIVFPPCAIGGRPLGLARLAGCDPSIPRPLPVKEKFIWPNRFVSSGSQDAPKRIFRPASDEGGEKAGGPKKSLARGLAKRSAAESTKRRRSRRGKDV